MAWSATQYTKFEAERNRPIRDLIAQLPQGDIATAVDLGCGPGNSTEYLAARFPSAAITGIDTSTDMLDAARTRLPNVRFELADIATWTGGPVDVLLANASLHWVPDHATLMPALVAKLAPGGSLAVQMPDNLDEPTHRLMVEVADAGPWAAKLASAAHVRTPRHEPVWYAELLRDRVATMNIWRTVYHHPLAGAAAVVEWFRGSGLRPFLELLAPDERIEFLARYTAGIERAYPTLADGTVLLPFPRLFFVATR